MSTYKRISWLLLAALPAAAQNYATYNGNPVARMSFLRHQIAPSQNALGDRTLQGFWPLTESGSLALDESGNGLTGSWTGKPSGTNGNYSAGKIAPNAATFLAANSDYVSTVAVTIPAQFSVAFWVNYSSTSPSQATLFSDEAAASPYNGLDIRLNSGPLQLAIAIGSTNYTVNAMTPSVGSWYHVVYTFNGSSLIAYANGQLLNTTAASGTPAQSLITLHFGENPSFGGRYTSSKVEDVRFYSRALSVGEIQAIYSAENH